MYKVQQIQSSNPKHVLQVNPTRDNIYNSACERKPFFCWNTAFSRQSKKWENEKVTENCKKSFLSFSNKSYF
jgi:hypothetical protein